MKYKFRKYIPLIICILCVFCMFSLGGCDGAVSSKAVQADAAEEELSLFAMDTYMTLKAYGENAGDALKKAKDEIIALDELLSTGNPDSEVSRINLIAGGEKISLSETVSYLMKRSLEANEMSGGAFNPLIYPVMRAWGFTDENYQVPDKELLNSLRDVTDISMLEYDEESGSLSFKMDGIEIDFGGIAKGYTSERVIQILKENGVESAVVSLGGNVQTLGVKPDGSMWKIAIRDPEDASGYIGVLRTEDKAVITSGGYERFFEEDGKVYHHIIDPETFFPADSGIISSTVISDDAALADALSTAVFVMGVEKASQMWQEHRDSFDLIMLADDGQLYITEGIKDRFSADGFKINVTNAFSGNEKGYVEGSVKYLRNQNQII